MRRSVIKDINGKKLRELDIFQIKEGYNGEDVFIVTSAKPLKLAYNRSYGEIEKEYVEDVMRVLSLEFEILDNVVDIAHALFDKAGIYYGKR
jgi:hypothetical protein